MSPLELTFPKDKTYGLLAEFEDTSTLYQACERVRDAGYSKWDAHTPFPVHGLEKAMGLPSSKLGWIVITLAILGATSGFLLQTWIHAEAYPLNISGKPFYSWPAYLPVTFELGVLGAAFGAVFGMFALNKLPSLFHPLFSSKNFERASDDRFFISIESWDPNFDLKETRELLQSLGAVQVETIANES